MLITLDVGTTGLSPAYQIVDRAKAVIQARTSVGVTELIEGAGVYAVDVPEPLLHGNTIIWDTGESYVPDRRYAIQSFDSAGAWSTNKMIVTEDQIRVRNHNDTADLFTQPLSEWGGARTRGAVT